MMPRAGSDLLGKKKRVLELRSLWLLPVSVIWWYTVIINDFVKMR
jgi:hypothetical protein